jgi:hypothetical protein
VFYQQYIQNWFNQIENSSRGQFYGIFKNEFNLDKYLLKLIPHERNMITKLRCNNIKLPIETGRWPNTFVQNLNITQSKQAFHFVHVCISSIINWNKFTSKPLYISRGTFK